MNKNNQVGKLQSEGFFSCCDLEQYEIVRSVNPEASVMIPKLRTPGSFCALYTTKNAKHMHTVYQSKQISGWKTAKRLGSVVIDA